MKTLLKTLTIVLALGIATTPASASNCAPRKQVVERLETKYGEFLVASGLQGKQRVTTAVEIWASLETGTFTIILTNPKGLSCVVATGTEFFYRKPPTIIEGDDL